MAVPGLTGFSDTLNNPYVIVPNFSNYTGPTGGSWMNWTVNANTIQAIGPTGSLATAMTFAVGGTGYATLSSTGFIMLNPPPFGDNSNKIATTSWVKTNGGGGISQFNNPTSATYYPVFAQTNVTATLNNVYSSSTVALNPVTNNMTIGTMTVGSGGGAVATNTAVGVSALNTNTTSGVQNTAIGAYALAVNTLGTPNTAVGYQALNTNLTGNNNVAVGDSALKLSPETIMLLLALRRYKRRSQAQVILLLELIVYTVCQLQDNKTPPWGMLQDFQ